jgi:hypothetical protein
LRTDLNSKFPRHLVAAGHIAVAAYYTVKQVPAKNPQTVKYTWYLYQPTSDTYAKTSWADLDVAPGMHQAAVLEGPLPTTRVGILDMATQKVTRWISVDHPVGDVAWAPDGRRLLLTGYPARSNKITDPGSSTGFYVMDARADPGTFHPVPMDPDNPSTRADFHWSRTGALLWEDSHTLPRRFFDLRGNQVPAPKLEAEAHEEAGLSPNGKLMPSFGPGPGPNITTTNVETGKTGANLPVEQARAWADDEHLIALACNPDACTGKGEFRNRLVLAGLDGKITPLTGYRDSQAPDAWEPIFTHR